jgi:hypothetical protein
MPHCVCSYVLPVPVTLSYLKIVLCYVREGSLPLLPLFITAGLLSNLSVDVIDDKAFNVVLPCLG